VDGLEEILGVIVFVVFLLIQIFGRAIVRKRRQQESERQAPRPSAGDHGDRGGRTHPQQPRPMGAEQDPFDALRRRIEEAARRRQEEEARRRREGTPPAPPQPQRPAEPIPAPMAGGRDGRTRPQPQPVSGLPAPPHPQPVPQPQVRRQQRRPAPVVVLEAKPQAVQPSVPFSSLDEHKHIMPARRKEPSARDRIDALPPLKKAIVMAEILGPPKGL